MIDNSTECLMPNMMALDQCLYPLKNSIYNYIFLISRLIGTEDDVDFLVEKKITKNFQGSNKEEAALINELYQNITTVHFIFSDECNKLNKFCGKWYNLTKPTIKRVYLRIFGLLVP